MKRSILLAIADFYQMNQAKDILEKEIGDVKVDHVVDEQMAKEKISSRAYDLVVIHQHLPLDRKTPIKEEEKRGVGLSKWIDSRDNPLPVVQLVLPSDTEVRAAVAELPNCEVVIIEPSWEMSLMKQVRKVFAANPVKENKRLDVSIYIDLEKNLAEVDLKGVNLGFSFEKHALQIKGSNIIELSMNADRAVDRTDGKKWQNGLKKVGETLMQRIFEKNLDFYIGLRDLISKVGGLQNTRIRFIVGEKVHAVALESLFGHHEFQKKDYWMLHAPIYRTIQDCPGEEFPLFHQDDADMRGRPINVLIVESPTEGTIMLNGFEKHLGKLKNVATECRYLEDYLRTLKTTKQANIGDVELVSWTNRREPMKDRVRKSLEDGNRSWHVVHYAGHSYFDHRTQSGHVFFPGPRKTIESVKMDLLSLWLRKAKTRFIFLSSCHSSESGFVFAMARQHIPAIVGFRWDIDDDMAFQYTQEFYRELLAGKKRSLEYAFLNARKKIYAMYKDNPIWAAPVLVVQIPLH